MNHFDTNREINFPGFAANPQASIDGEQEYAYASGGHDYHYKNWTFGPTAGLQYVHQNLDSFTERGAGMLDLDVNSHDADSLRSRLGGRVYFAAPCWGIVWRPFLDASWQHEFLLNGNSLTSSFDGSNGEDFTVPLADDTRDSALVSVGEDIDIDPDTNVFVAYRVEAGSEDFFAQSVEAGFKLNF